MAKTLSGKRIGVIGKGGSGKSTVVTLLAHALTRSGYDVYVLDANSTNVGLHMALGIDEAPDPLLDYFGGSVFSGGAVTCPVDDPTLLEGAHTKEIALGDKYIKRSADGIHLMIAGKVAELGPGAGCDGPVAKITRDLRIETNSQNPVTLVDFKAGFEDSARGVIVGLDAIIVVVDPTTAALNMATAMTRMVDAIRQGGLPATRHLKDPFLVALANRLYRKSKIRDVFVLLNKVIGHEMETYMREVLAGESIFPVGVIHEDPGLTSAWLTGTILEGPVVDREAGFIVRRLEQQIEREELNADKSTLTQERQTVFHI